jgi:hypothetical protein
VERRRPPREDCRLQGICHVDALVGRFARKGGSRVRAVREPPLQGAPNKARKSMEPLGLDRAIPMPKLHAIALCRLVFPVDRQIHRHYCISQLALDQWPMDLQPEIGIRIRISSHEHQQR